MPLFQAERLLVPVITPFDDEGRLDELALDTGDRESGQIKATNRA